jgi:putative transposase
MPKSTFKLQLPRSWPAKIRLAMLHVVSLAKYAAVCTRSWAANSPSARVRGKADIDRLREEVAQLRTEIRIKDARMECLPPHRRPYYPPAERLGILELRAARGWSLQQTADAFLLSPKTVAAWMKRVDESGPQALVQLRTPVNKFPDFVRYAVQRLQALCPALGKQKLAQVLARAGLHLSTTTVGRMRKENSVPAPPPQAAEPVPKSDRKVTAKRPNHVWQIDLTTMPTQSGFWSSWSPFALPQCWPFCWWIAVVLDHYSRRILGFAIFLGPPTSAATCALLGRVIRSTGTAPRHLISDKGTQFWPTQNYPGWCRRRDIRPRFGALGEHGSIAVLERAIRTLKEALGLLVVPTRRSLMQREVGLLIAWYNHHRPHTTLGGKTPDEVYGSLFPANRRPRLEPRATWPRGSPCAWPQALIAGKPGAKFRLDVERMKGHAHLPIVRLQRAA